MRLLLLLIVSCAPQILWAVSPSQYTGYYNSLAAAEPAMPEKERIQLHFSLLLKKLENAETSHLSAEQKAARAKNLEVLRRYKDAGVFPKNDIIAKLNPVFIDRQGTYCAVGYLIATTGHADLAKAIAAEQNLAYVPEIKIKGLKEWFAASGFSLEECAMIQPSYEPMPYVEPCSEPLPLRACMPGLPEADFATFIFFQQDDSAKVQLLTTSLEPVTAVAAAVYFKGEERPQLIRFQHVVLEDPGLNLSPSRRPFSLHGKVHISVQIYGIGEASAGFRHKLAAYRSRRALADDEEYFEIPLLKIFDIAAMKGAPGFWENARMDETDLTAERCTSYNPSCWAGYSFRAFGQLRRSALKVEKVVVSGVDNAGNLGSSTGDFLGLAVDKEQVFSNKIARDAAEKLEVSHEYFKPIKIGNAVDLDYYLDDQCPPSTCFGSDETKKAE